MEIEKLIKLIDNSIQIKETKSKTVKLCLSSMYGEFKPNTTKEKTLELIGDNPGKLKRLYTLQHGENVITTYEICGIKFQVVL